MLAKEAVNSFIRNTWERLNYAKEELANDPVLETSLVIGSAAGRLLNVAYIPAFYLMTKLHEATSLSDWRHASAHIGASLLIMSLTEAYAIKRKKYCNNTNTNLINLILRNPTAAIGLSKVWSFTGMLNPANPVDFGLVTYVTATGDWDTYLNFLSARYTVKATYNSGMDLLIATGKLDPLFEKVQLGKNRFRRWFFQVRADKSIDKRH